jgi:predicted MPP superfamily phosphohydrolase
MIKSKRIVIKHKGDLKIFIIPDQHFPFVNKKNLKSLIAAVKEHKPNYIVNVGDTYDQYNFSRFARSLDIMTPQQELLLGRKMAEKMWRDIQAASPKARCFQLSGNHEDRIRKRVMEKLPEIESLVENPIRQLTEFPGVEQLGSSRSELEINGVIFTHGWFTKPGDHAKYYLKSVVHGHTHKGNVTYVACAGKTLFELDCGYIADPDTIPLEYTPTKTSRWNPGYGFIDKNGPRFIPL